MAVIETKTGFFSSSGALDSKSLKSSGYDEWQAARKAGSESTAGAGGSTDLTEKVASDAFSQIAEAAVVKISNRMNVGDTGFDSEALPLVESALSSLASRRGSTSAAAPEASTENSPGSSSKQAVGGTYQNSLIAESNAARAKAAAAENPPAQEESEPPPPPPPTTEPPEERKVKDLAEKYVRRHEEKSGRKLSDDERTQKIDEVAKHYSEPGRAHRLQKMLDETA